MCIIWPKLFWTCVLFLNLRQFFYTNSCLFFSYNTDLKFSTDMSNLRRISFNAMPIVQWIKEVGASKSLYHRVRSPEMYELRWGRSSEVLQLQRLINCEYLFPIWKWFKQLIQLSFKWFHVKRWFNDHIFVSIKFEGHDVGK